MAAADANEKPLILTWLRERRIPAIEVGMGIRDEDGHLSGLLAVVNHYPEAAEQTTSASPGGPNEYDRNIQVADLNSLNAMLAVVNWKKRLGYYASADSIGESVYKLFSGTIRNGISNANTDTKEVQA